MASDVDICNLALSHLGDSATIATIDPPEGSAQAEHAARLYPVARDELLEAHAWGFATRRASLAQLSNNPSSTWAYCYALPANTINILAVLDPQATDDYSVAPLSDLALSPIINTGGYYSPQPYQIETLADGTECLLTDQPNAVLRFTVRVTDTTKFTPTFVTCLSWLLGSYLAGPILKGEAGAGAARACFQTYMARLEAAIESDANQRQIKPVHNVAWIASR